MVYHRRVQLSSSPTIVWFRRDLRLSDHAALAAAAARGPVVCCFIWSPDEAGAWAPGAASRWWLYHSLASLDKRLRALGVPLTLRRGPVLPALATLVDETGARRVTFLRHYEPHETARELEVSSALAERSVTTTSFEGGLLTEPGQIRTQSGGPFQVFSPFWKRCLQTPLSAECIPAPDGLEPPDRRPASLALEALDLLPRVDWAGGLRASWSPGEPGA